MPILEGLEAVDWVAIEHAYGAAVDTPGHLRALAKGDPKARKVALAKLEETIHHQTETYPASAAAVPFLVAIAMDSAHADRVPVLSLIAGLAIGDPSAFAREGFDVRSTAGQAALAIREGGLATYAAVAKELPRIATLLQDPDDALRRAAPFVLAIFADRAAETLPVVRNALEREKDPFAKASMLLAMRFLATAAQDKNDIATLDDLIARGTPADVEACAAAIARISIAGRDEAALALLARRKATKKAPGFFWGDLKWVATWAIDALDLDKPIEELVGELESGAANPERAHKILVRVLPEVLLPHDGSHLLASELSPLARRALHAAATHGYIASTAFEPFFAGRGVPPYNEHRLWLGIDPAGLLERVVVQAGREWPVWKWIHAAVKAELHPAEVVSAVTAHLTEDERVAMIYPDTGPLVVYRYELVCAYDANGPEDTLGRRRGEEALDDVLASVLVTCGSERLHALGAAIVAKRRGVVNYDALLVALGRIAHGAGKPFPEDLHALWERPRLRRIFRDAFASAPLPMRERRLQAGDFAYEAITLRTPQGPREDIVLMYGWTVMDLCPTEWAAQYTVDAILTYRGPVEGVRQLVDILVRMGAVARGPVEEALADKTQRKNALRSLLVDVQRILNAS